MKWTVKITEAAETQLVLDIESGQVTPDDIAVLKKWIEEIENHGVEVAQRNPSWRDHDLGGKWSGHRSISFSFKGRVIYRLEKKRIIVRVVRVSHDHDYS
jgi:mRNA-degrading endonuclease YafQ of YafQ-DinJ toxin-antitoxin module